MTSKTYLGVSRDHSGSMQNIARAAQDDFNTTIRAIRSASAATGQDTYVSVVQCGVNHVHRESAQVPIANVPELRSYPTPGMTPLFDSVGDLIDEFEVISRYAPKDTAFVVMAITDGGENGSRRWTAQRLANKIRELQMTDRWTFVFRVPKGGAREMIRYGIPAANILEWDQTQRGVEVATQATTAAYESFYQERSRGVTATKKFYADSNMAAVDLKTVQAQLVDISSQISIWLTTAKETIAPYCERMSKAPFIKGAAFYQLVKTESDVQDYKKIVVRHKVTGAVYGGAAARQLLGLPLTGTCGLRVGNNGDYDVYVQSTSFNRVLPPGTTLLYWPTHDQAPTAPVVITPAPTQQALKTAVAKGQKPVKAKTPVAKVALTPAPAWPFPTGTNPVTPGVSSVAATAMKVSADFIKGYKAGFAAGKVKAPMTASGTTQYALGYAEGYKHGKGKKKNLHK